MTNFDEQLTAALGFDVDVLPPVTEDRAKWIEVKRLITRLAPPNSTRVSDTSARIHAICDERLGETFARKIEQDLADDE